MRRNLSIKRTLTSIITQHNINYVERLSLIIAHLETVRVFLICISSLVLHARGWEKHDRISPWSCLEYQLAIAIYYDLPLYAKEKGIVSRCASNGRLLLYFSQIGRIGQGCWRGLRCLTVGNNGREDEGSSGARRLVGLLVSCPTSRKMGRERTLVLSSLHSSTSIGCSPSLPLVQLPRCISLVAGTSSLFLCSPLSKLA